MLYQSWLERFVVSIKQQNALTKFSRRFAGDGGGGRKSMFY
jgi:hypothetical protein